MWSKWRAVLFGAVGASCYLWLRAAGVDRGALRRAQSAGGSDKAGWRDH